ncbi:MAG: serine hydrolase domain-containing protein [Cyanobacteria bacterium J06649_11]
MTRQKSTTNILLLLICLLGSACGNYSETKETNSAENIAERFQTILEAMYEAHPESIGIVAHVESPPNGISWSGSAGYSSKAGAKLLPDEPVLIASSIKTYIAAAILRLQEQGKLSIQDSISKYLTQKTSNLFKTDGYDFDAISIGHLLSHTSGIQDYTNEAYIDFIDKNKKYRWTRDEQLERTVAVGDPLGKPQDLFSYADANYLLCTEIIEQVTQQPFYEALRALLKYEQLGFNNTWFPTLETKPDSTKELAHQYWSEKGWDSYDIDPSFDLYGGGGIATTAKELAQFSHHLFTHQIIEDQHILSLLSTAVKTRDGKNNGYGLGLSIGKTKGFVRYGHGGFWGSQVLYFPKLNTSISVFVLEKGVKNQVIKNTIDKLVSEWSAQLYLEETVMAEGYRLYKAKNTQSTLVLYPGGGTTAKEIKEEFDIVNLANANGISVVLMNFNRHLWIDEATTKRLAVELEGLYEAHGLNPEDTYMGGMSIGGNVALTLSDYLYESQRRIQPKGVFIVDSPIDLFALYQSSQKDLSNPHLDEARLAEPQWIVNYFEEAFGKDSLLANISKVSPFTQERKTNSILNLKQSKLRFYTEPDSLWYQENRQTDFESTNASAIQQVAQDLKSDDWDKFELIETTNKGYRANGERNPHSWSIVDGNELIEWIKE